MSKHWHFCTFLIVLLLAVPAFADGGRGDQPSAALSICPECEYEISADPAPFGNWSEDWTIFYNSFFIDANGQEVDEVYLTFFIHSTAVYLPTYSIDCIEPYDVFETATTADGKWFHFEWTELDSIPTVDNPMMTFSTYGLICHDELTALQIELKDSSGAGWHNQFHATSGVQDPATLTDGYQWFIEPLAEATVVGPDDVTGDVVATGYRGGEVEVPIWLDTMTFDFYENLSGGMGYWEITVGIDDGLVYEDFDGTGYTGYGVDVDVSVDNEITLTGGLYAGISMPAGDVLFGTLTLYLDPDETEDEGTYRVWVKGEQTYEGCVDFGTTFTNISDTVLVEVAEKEASWRIGAALKCKGLQNFAMPFYLATSALVYTDVAGTDVNAAFTFDTSYLSYTTYDYVTSEFSYNGGTMYWDASTNTDPYVKVFEDPWAANPSTTVEVTGDYEQIGALVLDLADAVYTESLVFVNAPEYDNYVVFTYDEDVLDAYVDEELTLVDGSISTYTCGGPDPGCPALYVWTGKTFVLQDYVLTHSQTQLSPTAADDYLPISYGIAEEDGYYRIQIREFENEITFLDQVELVVADYADESQIGISVAGEVFTHRESIEPIAAEDYLGRDVLSMVGSEDGVLYEADGPGSLTLTYRNVADNEDNHGFGVSLRDAPIKEYPEPAGNELADASGDRLYAEIEDASGNWHHLGGIPPREHSSATSQWAFDSFSSDLGETFRVKITWTQEYSVDCQTLQVKDNAPVTEHHLTPVEATHTVAGKVAASLVGADSDIITLSPGETIELKFKAPERIRGYHPNRAFYLKTHGYYESMAKVGTTVPETFALDDNYPNPFNPSTNIGLSLPQKQEVTLRVFNLLGQEVKTVYQGELDQGHHTLTWDGDNNNGESVASGVYFYRLETKDFAESKKMMLLK